MGFTTMRIDDPIYSHEVSTFAFNVPPKSSFVFSHTAEEARAIPSPSWFSQIDPSELTRVTIQADENDVITVRSDSFSDDRVISLFDSAALCGLLEELPQPIYVDITGLSHRVWAPIVRAVTLSTADVRIVYLEPEEYLGGTFRDAYKIYDLSKKFEGLRPLPGFAYIPTDLEVEQVSNFVPMVGFEGSRLEYMITQNEPDLRRTYPIIGVPGFRPDYAFFAYEGNRRSFERDFLHRRIRYAKANCPFEAFYLLRDIHEKTPEAVMRIALVGTKPHSLGAVLYALASAPSRVELIYDNPVRARDRSKGQSRVLIYALSAFVRSPAFRELAGGD